MITPHTVLLAVIAAGCALGGSVLMRNSSPASTEDVTLAAEDDQRPAVPPEDVLEEAPHRVKLIQGRMTIVPFEDAEAEHEAAEEPPETTWAELQEEHERVAKNFRSRILEIIEERELAGTANTIVEPSTEGEQEVIWPLGDIKIDKGTQFRYRSFSDWNGLYTRWDEIFERWEYPELFDMGQRRDELRREMSRRFKPSAIAQK